MCLRATCGGGMLIRSSTRRTYGHLVLVSSAAMEKQDEFQRALEKIAARVTERHEKLPKLPITSSRDTIWQAIAALPESLPETGLGTEGAIDLILSDLSKGFTQAQNGGRYFGFVTGGVTEAAQLSDMLASSYDENVQTVQPEVTISTALEARTLEMVLDLLDIPRTTFTGRTLTTGATASNIVGLTCARDSFLTSHPDLPSGYSIAEYGFPSCLPSPAIVVLAVSPHASFFKAAAVSGIGRSNVINMPHASGDENGFDLGELQKKLQGEKERGAKVIVGITMGEVNTGGFGRNTRQAIDLARKFGAWVHVDGAFGGFAGLLPELRSVTEEMMLADSVTLDGHKWLNVPYDCGIFFCRNVADMRRSFGPSETHGVPAYLTSAPEAVDDSRPKVTIDPASVPPPLYHGIENSRRFRALPLFASLMSLGKAGYQDLVARNIHFARAIAAGLPSSYELVNGPEIPLNTVLFRGIESSAYPPDDMTSGQRLAKAINDTKIIYVTPTIWQGKPAVRLAVCNWRTGAAGEEQVVLDVLRRAIEKS